MYASISWLKTGHPKTCADALASSTEACHKITDIILGLPFLSISMVCNSKILPNIMQIKVVSAVLGASRLGVSANPVTHHDAGTRH